MPKYIFITKAEKKEAECPVIQVAHDEMIDEVIGRHLYAPRDFDMLQKIDPYFEVETIRAREFRVGKNGRSMFIGLCQEAQDAIGVWLESFENLQKAYTNLHNDFENCKKLFDLFEEETARLVEEKAELESKLNFYRNMSFWQRLRFLFKIW